MFPDRARFARRTSLLSAMLLLLGVAAPDVTRAAPTITISGAVNDAQGLPLSGIQVRLYREGPPDLGTTTDANGRFSWQVPAGRYRVEPKLFKCTFLPALTGMKMVTASTNYLFGGSGPGCGGQATVNAGAMTGPLTLGGHVRDDTGNPVVGARIDLSGATRAVRFTDFTGGYTFHVDPGTYGLAASGQCPITPATAKVVVSSATVRDFVGSTVCVTAIQSNVIATGSVFSVKNGSLALGTTFAKIAEFPTAGDALARLQEIADEQAAPYRSLTIAGNPAIERQLVVTLGPPDPDFQGGTDVNEASFLTLTAAIAVGNAVVRFESHLDPDADAATIAQFFQASRNFTPDALPDLHGPAPVVLPMLQNGTPPPLVVPGILASGLLAPGVAGELQIAASDTFNAIVYGTQNGPFVSTDGGQTVKAATFNTVAAAPAAAFISKGDPTVGVGAPDGSFHQDIYYAQLVQAAPAAAGAINPTIAIGLYRSTDNGQIFNSAGFPVNCSTKGSGCVVPDQEHMAVDRVNRAVAGGVQSDQLYLAWRNFTSATNNSHSIGVACSRDGGKTWTTDLVTIISTGADLPRVAVGPDGTFLVAYAQYATATTYNLQVQRWSSCANGFKADPKPVNVKTVTEVTDMPGLDRAPIGNYQPAFDDGDGTAQTIFLVYANEVSAGNVDIHVAESKDGGAKWERDSIVNTVGTGRRWFPYICSTAGKKFVSWYDRRNSTAASPDLTAYFRSSVFDNGSATAVGIGTEVNVSGVDDPQCSSGFPVPVRSAIEESGCTNLPVGVVIPAGTCQAACAPGAAPPCGSGQPCDFRAPACPAVPAPETCTPGSGQPKYGDYNGAACAGGTHFVAWASSTPPKDAACTVLGLACTAASQCCSANCVGGACAPSPAACTANGAACGPALPTCCSQGLNGLCQGGICMPAITMFTASSCLGPGCAGIPVQIRYHQVGACNGYNPPGGPGHSVGPNQAYVFFAIESIDNSPGTTAFDFDPGLLFAEQGTAKRFLDSLSRYMPTSSRRRRWSPRRSRPGGPRASGRTSERWWW